MVHADEQRFRRITDRLAVALAAARSALGSATAVVLGEQADDGMKAAEQALHELRGQIEELVPTRAVAHSRSGVRAAVAVVHLGGDLQRLAELTQQIAEIGWSRTGSPLPGGLRSALEAVTGGVLDLVGRAGQAAVLEPSAAARAAAGLERDLDTVADRQRALEEVLVAADPPLGAAGAADVALLGRCYESCAQHAAWAVRHAAVLAAN